MFRLSYSKFHLDLAQKSTKNSPCLMWMSMSDSWLTFHPSISSYKNKPKDSIYGSKEKLNRHEMIVKKHVQPVLSTSNVNSVNLKHVSRWSHGLSSLCWRSIDTMPYALIIIRNETLSTLIEPVCCEYLRLEIEWHLPAHSRRARASNCRLSCVDKNMFGKCQCHFEMIDEKWWKLSLAPGGRSQEKSTNYPLSNI